MGIASGKARRKKRTMKAAAKLLLDMELTDATLREELNRVGLQEEDLTNQLALLVRMFQKALDGDVKAATFLRDTAGESPVERMHTSDRKLKREIFAYQKEKDAGMIDEIEDLEELEADIYGEKETE